MIGIIDYGAGNTQSVRNALDRLEIPHFLSSHISELAKAERIILPGVGHARTAMEALTMAPLTEFLRDFDRPVLGICLGMQLLCKSSEEGNTNCLGISESRVQRFNALHVKVPSMGWNQVQHRNHELFEQIPNGSYFYFVHSYYVPDSPDTIARASYDLDYAAAIQKDNFYGVQFHPEKSGKAGRQLLQNFNKISVKS